LTTKFETHLDTHSSIQIDKRCIDKLFLDFLDLWVVQSSSNETFQRADRILEVGGLLRLCGLTNCTLFWAESNQRSKNPNELKKSKRKKEFKVRTA